MCNRRSTWDVVKNGKDFKGIGPMTDDNSPTTTFRIVQPQSSARYVLVLDRSGSMNTNARMEKLKQSAEKWIKYDLKLKSKLGITSFSSSSNGNSATEDMPLTELRQNNKQTFIEKIEGLNPNGNQILANVFLNFTDTKSSLHRRYLSWKWYHEGHGCKHIPETIKKCLIVSYNNLPI